ncbi:MAG: class I SAM-dependent methyltransferase [Spirochaetia bacterium]|nr:class I SAM-dependent methyltransferase [Spirochaetia bacterium]
MALFRFNSYCKKIHTAILSDKNWNYILDYGCGKGAFTHTFKKNNNRVVGVDVSQNAIKKATDMYGHLVEFSILKNEESLSGGGGIRSHNLFRSSILY